MFWDWLGALVVRAPLLGWIGAGLAVALAVLLLVWVLRELAGLARLRRLDRIQAAARVAVEQGDLRRAQAVVAELAALYAGRAEVRASLDGVQAMQTADGGALLAQADRAVIGPLDAQALAAVEQAARTVAATTALVPLPLADIGTALVANLRMIGQVARIYGGRGGTLGSWRLTRAVMAHLVATGALAVGEDLIGAAGGGVIARLSRRFGEGVVNGALTVRVGLTAMDLCRPLPWADGARPGMTAVLGRAIRGLFQREDE
jgi:putative membrane protein